MLGDLLTIGLLDGALRALTPILLAALAGALCERTGVFNIALEGTLLIGCFAAVAGSWTTGSADAGVLIAALAGMAFMAILAGSTLWLGGDQIVVGLGLNLLAVGITGYLLRIVFDVRGTFTSPALDGLTPIDIPGLSAVPVIGPSLDGQTWVTYLAWLLVPACWVLLMRTHIGLRLRGTGEHAAAAASLGVSPTRYRGVVILVSGILCGLGGAQLALGSVTLFSENMTAGRGWIAVVAVMLGRAGPWGIAAASLLFAVSEAAGFRLQGQALPQQITDAFPYVATLIALVLTSLRWRRRPAPDQLVPDQLVPDP